MTVRLTPKRCLEIIELCTELSKSKCVTLRTFAKVIGKLVATEPGVDYAVLYINL